MEDDFLLKKAIDEYKSISSDKHYANMYLSQSQTIKKVYESLGIKVYNLARAKDNNEPNIAQIIDDVFVRYDILLEFDHHKRDQVLLQYLDFFIKQDFNQTFKDEYSRIRLFHKLIRAVNKYDCLNVFERLDSQIAEYLQFHHDKQSIHYLLGIIKNNFIKVPRISSIVNELSTSTYFDYDENADIVKAKIEEQLNHLKSLVKSQAAAIETLKHNEIEKAEPLLKENIASNYWFETSTFNNSRKVPNTLALDLVAEDEIAFDQNLIMELEETLELYKTSDFDNSAVIDLSSIEKTIEAASNQLEDVKKITKQNKNKDNELLHHKQLLQTEIAKIQYNASHDSFTIETPIGKTKGYDQNGISLNLEKEIAAAVKRIPGKRKFNSYATSEFSNNSKEINLTKTERTSERLLKLELTRQLKIKKETIAFDIPKNWKGDDSIVVSANFITEEFINQLESASEKTDDFTTSEVRNIFLENTAGQTIETSINNEQLRREEESFSYTQLDSDGTIVAEISTGTISSVDDFLKKTIKSVSFDETLTDITRPIRIKGKKATHKKLPLDKLAKLGGFAFHANRIVDYVLDIKAKNIDSKKFSSNPHIDDIHDSVKLLKLRPNLFEGDLDLEEMKAVRNLKNELQWLFLKFNSKNQENGLWTYVNELMNKLIQREACKDFVLEINKNTQEIALPTNSALPNVEEFFSNADGIAYEEILTLSKLDVKKEGATYDTFVSCPFNCVVDLNSAHICNNLTMELARSKQIYDVLIKDNDDKHRLLVRLLDQYILDLPQDISFNLINAFSLIFADETYEYGNYLMKNEAGFTLLVSGLESYVYWLTQQISKHYGFELNFEELYSKEKIQSDLKLSSVTLGELARFIIGNSKITKSDRNYHAQPIAQILMSNGKMDDANRLIHLYESLRLLLDRQTYKTDSKAHFNVGLNIRNIIAHVNSFENSLQSNREAITIQIIFLIIVGSKLIKELSAKDDEILN